MDQAAQVQVLAVLELAAQCRQRKGPCLAASALLHPLFHPQFRVQALEAVMSDDWSRDTCLARLWRPHQQMQRSTLLLYLTRKLLFCLREGQLCHPIALLLLPRVYRPLSCVQLRRRGCYDTDACTHW